MLLCFHPKTNTAAQKRVGEGSAFIPGSADNSILKKKTLYNILKNRKYTQREVRSTTVWSRILTGVGQHSPH